jgi:hypothetical protein
MAAMFEEAGYEKELQFENLLIHYYWTVRLPPSMFALIPWPDLLIGTV